MEMTAGAEMLWASFEAELEKLASEADWEHIRSGNMIAGGLGGAVAQGAIFNPVGAVLGAGLGAHAAGRNADERKEKILQAFKRNRDGERVISAGDPLADITRKSAISAAKGGALLGGVTGAGAGALAGGSAAARAGGGRGRAAAGVLGGVLAGSGVGGALGATSWGLTGGLSGLGAGAGVTLRERRLLQQAYDDRKQK